MIPLKRNFSYPLLYLLFSFFHFSLLSSCKKIDVFERTVAIPQQQWNYQYKPSFSFIIEDTTRLYNASVIIRHTDAYQYQNLYLALQVKYPGSDSVIKEKVNIPLADNSHGWYGSAMDDIWEFRFPLNKTPLRLRKGNYHFVIEQIMRDNPLPNVMNVGIRVEKAP
jgi:gliding motility-associated lipoprotein GldH